MMRFTWIKSNHKTKASITANRVLGRDFEIKWRSYQGWKEMSFSFNSIIFIFDCINFETHYKRWKMIIYMAMSLVLVNISLSSIRIFLIIKFKALKPSRIFLGKNLIFFFVQTLKLCKAVKVSFHSSVYA